MIKGKNHLFSDTVPPLGSYQEHYLVPDGGEIMIQKADSLKTGTTGNPPSLPGPTGDYWLLQPKNKNAGPLSSILEFLEKEFAGSITVCWTCCRSPIGQPGMYKTMWDPNSPNVYSRKLTDKAAYKLEGHDKPVNRPEADYEVKHTLAAGTVSLYCANDPGLTLETSWPGINGVGTRRKGF
jgi:hypothetical protein